MHAASLAEHLRTTADMCRVADMPADPSETTEVLDAGKHLAAELTRFMARTRAHRVANRDQWAAHTAAVRGAFDPEGMPPPPPPPPPDPPPEPTPQPDPGGDQ